MKMKNKLQIFRKLKEPHAKVRRAACGSQAVVWPPLVYVIYLANTENHVGPGSPLSISLRTLLKTRCIPER